MKSELIDHYFPRGLAWTVLVLTFGLSVYLIGWLQHFGWPIFFVFLNLIMFTPTYITSVDTHSKVILDEFRIFWIPIRSTEKSFQQLHCIQLEKERETHRAMSRSRDRIADFFQYVGILKFDRDNLEIARDTDYHSFKEKMDKMSNQLGIPLDRRF